MNNSEIKLVLKTLWAANPNAAEDFVYNRTLTAEEMSSAKMFLYEILSKDSSVLDNGGPIGDRLVRIEGDIPGESWLKHLGFERKDMLALTSSDIASAIEEKEAHLSQDVLFKTGNHPVIVAGIIEYLWQKLEGSEKVSQVEVVRISDEEIELNTFNSSSLIGKGGENIRKISRLLDRRITLQ